MLSLGRGKGGLLALPKIDENSGGVPLTIEKMRPFPTNFQRISGKFDFGWENPLTE